MCLCWGIIEPCIPGRFIAGHCTGRSFGAIFGDEDFVAGSWFRYPTCVRIFIFAFRIVVSFVVLVK